MNKVLSALAAAGVAAALAACGSSNSDNTNSTADGSATSGTTTSGGTTSGGTTSGGTTSDGTTSGGTSGGVTTPTATLSGSVAKGPAVSGEVCVYKINAGQPAAQSEKCTAITPDGTYQMQVTADLADLLLEARNVQFRDEANNGVLTGLPGSLKTVIPGPAANGSAAAAITALTTIAYESLSARGSGIGAAAFATEAAKVAQAFGVQDIVGTPPAFNAQTLPTNAYGTALAAIAQYVKVNALEIQSTMRSIGQAWGTTEMATYQNGLQAALNNYCTLNAIASCPTLGLAPTDGGTGTPPSGLPPSGTATCRVQVDGTITVSAPGVPGGTINTPVSIGVCIVNFPGAGCDSSLDSGLNFSQLLQQVPGFAAGNLTYAYSSPASCPAGDYKFDYNNGNAVPLP